MHKSYANTVAFYIRDLSTHGFKYTTGDPKTKPDGCQKDNSVTKIGKAQEN